MMSPLATKAFRLPARAHDNNNPFIRAGILEAYDSKNMDNSMLHVTVEMRLMVRLRRDGVTSDPSYHFQLTY